MNHKNLILNEADGSQHIYVTEFKRHEQPHAHYNACMKELMRLAERSGSSGVVILTGPTGSGKTHMARHLYNHLKSRFSKDVIQESEMESTFQAYAPVVGIRAVPPRANSFDWQDFYVRLLESLGDLLAEKKLLISDQMSLFAEFPSISPAESMKVMALQRKIEKSLRMRKTRVLIIDEAHHILMCKDPDQQRFIFEQLKSLTDETGIKLILVGTYDLIDIQDHSGQLMRRSEILHLKRYDYIDKFQLVDFYRALKGLIRVLPIPLSHDISKDPDLCDFFYKKSAGCIGILKELFLNCIQRAIEENKKEIDKETVEKSAKSNLAISTILREAMNGEVRLVDKSDEFIRSLLLNGVGAELEEEGDANENQPARKSAARRGRSKPGMRNPKRDKVGDLVK